MSASVTCDLERIDSPLVGRVMVSRYLCFSNFEKEAAAAAANLGLQHSGFVGRY